MRLELESNPSSLPFTENSGIDEPTQNNSSEAREILHDGIRAAQAGNRAHARASLLRAAEIDSRNESTWLWLASISEYPEELLVFLNNVLDINPSNERALEWMAATKSLLAKTFVQRGIDVFEASQPDFAVQYFNDALEYDPQNEMAWLWMASLSDSNEEKITCLEKVLSIDPDNQAAQMAFKSARQQTSLDLLAEAKAKAVSGKRDEANVLLDAILEESSDSEEAWILRAFLVDGFDEKISSYVKVLEINPENLAAQAGLASLRSIMQDVSSEVAAEMLAEETQEFSEESADEEIVDLDAAVEMATDEEMVTDTAEESEFFDPFTESASEAETVMFTYKEEEAEAYSETGEENPMEEFASDSNTHAVEETQAAPETVDEWAVDTKTGDADTLSQEAEFASLGSLHDFEASDESADDEQPAEADSQDLEAEPQSLESSEVAADLSDETSPVYVDEEAAEAYVSPAPDDEPKFEENDSMDDSFSLDTPEPVEDFSKTVFLSPAVADEQSPFDSLAADLEETGQPAPVEGIPMPESVLEGLEDAPATMGIAAQLDYAESESRSPITSSACPFCQGENEVNAFVCHTCMAVLTLSDLEMLLENPHADKLVLRQAIESMEREKSSREFDEYELTMLGIGHLNLRNLQFGYSYLQEASQINPNNVMLSSQVNALLIRLEEIKKRDEVHESKPKGKTILVVDDSPTVRKLISGKLEKCGHDVFCSADGVEAMERLQNLIPDLVLLDITMPRMDGYQVCKMIRSNEATKDVPVVMISGNDGFFDKVRGRMAGTSGYITKPFGPETLMKAVETYLKNEV